MKYFLFYLLFPFFTNSQIPDQDLHELFFKSKSVSWEKQYTGLWDDVIPVRFDLASDGESCKGFLYFGEDKNKYVVSGKLVNNEIRLEEQDLNSNITGLIVLQLNGEKARGTWYNSNHNFNASLVLKEGSEITNIAYWIKAFAPKENESESLVILHKDFADQINTRFYYKMLNKTLNGTVAIKDEEGYAQESQMEDYLHHQAGSLNSWKINDKKLDIRYKLGNIEYSQSLELVKQIPITQETFADHWMAVDINYLKIDHDEIKEWQRELIDTHINNIQNKKRLILTTDVLLKEDRMLYRMSIWPQIDFLNNKFVSGLMNIKNSWEDEVFSVPFIFDIDKGMVLSKADIIGDPTEFRISKDNLIKKELEKLKSSSSLNYEKLSPSDFNMMTIKKEGLAFTAPYDLIYGFRQIVIPYYEIRSALNPKYFPL